MTRTVTRRGTSTDKAATPSRSVLSSRFRKWALLKEESTALEKQLSPLRDELKAVALEIGTADENGHRIVELPPFKTDKATYTGMMAQRKSSQLFDEEAALALLKSKGSKGKAAIVTTTVVTETVDQDKLYALQQSGIISEAELDALISETVTWAFLPVKA